MPTKKSYYAYLVPDTGDKGVADNWDECSAHVTGVMGARFKKFKSLAEAEEWLNEGAEYRVRAEVVLEPGIYFDAGTGRGHGVEISVTDEQGNDLLASAMPKSKINRHGKHLVPGDVTNNYGELLACFFALKIAEKEKVKKIFGDSKLVINYWSRGIIKEDEVHPDTVALALAIKHLRDKFEAHGGTIERVSGDVNPADLGFH